MALATFALPAAAATVITEYDRSGFMDYVDDLVEQVQNFDGVPLPCALPVQCVSEQVSELGLSDLDKVNDVVSLSTNKGFPLIVTNARNSSSGLQSLAALIGENNYNLAADQTVTFNFSSSIVAFAIDINTFLQGLEEGDVGSFFADFFDEKGTLIGSVISQYSPFPTNSNPNANADVAAGKIGQFIGFSSNTPFNSVKIGQIDQNSDQPYSLDTLVTGKEPPPEPPAPVPAPLPMVLLMSGLALLALMRRRAHV